MLLEGLRSAEVLALNRDDALLSEAQLRVPGKGKKFRLLPLAPETVQLLEHYLRMERPNPCSAALFVSLKGHARGTRMTAAGLRSLFRYHRQATGIQIANPHRFRHTFASDMIRAGMSLPALMQLMGHTNIQTTLLYVLVTPQDVYLEYARAVAQHVRPLPKASAARLRAGSLKTPASCSATEGVVCPTSRRPRWSDRFFAHCSTRTGEVPPLAAKRHCSHSLQPPLQ